MPSRGCALQGGVQALSQGALLLHQRRLSVVWTGSIRITDGRTMMAMLPRLAETRSESLYDRLIQS
ncbi:hypothetical protein CKO42_24080 [Lamprobacter modestohalophilus]|uniref:Uncharacterized protein n=1 Tax=Lamprobacter modestohalophilus TaxID=1064514 RepID=A0A9X1B6S6_9GAMM|nr:hypothetical protein [Lamprobacter modestohalophilus]